MGRPRKWQTEAERRNAQTDRRKAERQTHNVEFIGVDGEGVGRWRDHKYVLLGVGDTAIENGGGLRFPEIADFLYQNYLANPKAAYVGFFLGYDFTQWFKTIPRERAWYLFTTAGIAKRQRRTMPQLGPFPVEYEGFEYDLLGMKRLKLRETGRTGWMYICDSGPFFQASLMSVIDPKKWETPIVTEDEYAILEEGKRQRDHAVLDPGMRRYNALENAVLARLMDQVNTGLSQANIKLKKNQWFGPGQAAQAWLSQVKAPTGESIRNTTSRHGPDGNSRSREHGSIPGSPGDGTTQNPNRRSIDSGSYRTGTTPLLDAARYSYYGGWFEIFAHGHIPGQSWEYDINSAYPWIISRLPCLMHGEWKHDNTSREPGERGGGLQLVKATVVGSDKRIGAMLHRREDHAICRPSKTKGWYWAEELNAAIGARLVDESRIHETWTYAPCDCRPPLRGIAGLYDERLKVGKNSPRGKGLKLVYNSVYGKFAQSVGEPKYGNAFYASLITSGCRSMILDAIATHPEGTYGVAMVATDGVYFTSRHSGLDIGERLGAWEETSHSNLTLFKPGVYWDDATREKIANGKDPAFKARGINAKEFASQLSGIDLHFSGWPARYPRERDPEGPREGWYPKVTFTSGFSMITCQQALQRGKWFLAGSVGSQELEQDADPITKRHSGYFENGIYWSKPFADGGPRLESYPYDKRFGQPDPEEYGINDDGTVKDQWAWMIRG